MYLFSIYSFFYGKLPEVDRFDFRMAVFFGQTVKCCILIMRLRSAKKLPEYGRLPLRNVYPYCIRSVALKQFCMKEKDRRCPYDYLLRPPLIREYTFGIYFSRSRLSRMQNPMIIAGMIKYRISAKKVVWGTTLVVIFRRIVRFSS